MTDFTPGPSERDGEKEIKREIRSDTSEKEEKERMRKCKRERVDGWCLGFLCVGVGGV